MGARGEGSSQVESAPAELDTGLACLVLLARYFGLAADSEQLRHGFGEPGVPFGVTEILRAAKSLGLKAGLVASSWARLGATPLPAIALLKNGAYVVLARVDAEKVLLQDPGEPRPAVLPREPFEQGWTGSLILLTRRVTDPAADRRFGFAWFVPALIRYRRFLGEILVASFFLQLFALLAPLFTQVVIDKVLVHNGLTTLHILAAGMLALTLFEAVLGGLRAYVLYHTSSRIDVELGARLFRHLLALPLAYFEARRVGDTVARVRELENIRQFLTSSTVTLVVDFLFTGVFLAVMFFYSLLLTVIVLVVLPAYVALSVVTTPIFRGRLNERFNRGAENYAFLVESVNGIQTVKAMAVEPQMQRRWEEQLAGYVRASLRAVNLGNVAGQLGAFLNKVTLIAILWVGAYLVMRGDLTVGELIAFNMLAGRVTGPVLRIVQLWQDFQQAGISVERLADVLNAPAEPSHRPTQTSLPTLSGQVVFDTVTFRYRPDRPEVLHDVSFSVPAGTVVGIVGRSGSGKSTIAKLIQRLYIPESGRVLVDGLDLAQIDPVWLRRQIGVVLQENFLFNRSVRENIALADPGLPFEVVVRAARLAGAHDFVLTLPEGYDTVVGEHGCSLSGGQRQRIAIARALVTDPRILIFDEATSALDYESERVIQQNLAQICAGRTVVIIAHRLSTVQPADHILVIDQGVIVERGTHHELLGLGRYYASLYGLQDGRGAPVGAGAA
ncbi:MAG TPA: type I secretion system permease/ATPase [Methylomirabilota bacterium]|nr:type I secretion system permease/ATPase [Methylomirabilota bacterium]